MQAIIEKIELTNFKGCRNAIYEFGKKSNSVLGQNGAGKSTIATAWYWVFSNCDSDLHNNPAIFPLDAEECTPMVRIWLNCNEKSVEVAKTKKRTVKKPKTGGADTVSLSNSYEVNSVEYGERDFKKKMAEYGFDFDLFLPLSHPDVFTSQKSADMRKVLFGMASEKSDKEIADMTDGAEDVAEMLTNYTAEEVKAMQNSTLRKIREEYGKDGEILRAKIEGMEQSKTDIDVAELELMKNSLNEQIAENKAKQEDISKEYEEQQKASDGILELKFELNDLQRKANEENNRKKRELDDKIVNLKYSIDKTDKDIGTAKREIEKAIKNIENSETELKTVREQWKSLNDMQFDKDEENCQMCGQRLPQEKIDILVSEFGERKAKNLSNITDRGNSLKKFIDVEKDRIEKLKASVDNGEKEKIELGTQLKELETQYNSIPQSIDISDRPEAQEIQRQIAEKEAAMKKGNSAEDIRQQLKDEGEDLQSQLTEVEKQLALAQKNVEIDEDISKLREKQRSFEQQKADCEKILDQLDMVSKRKNELLTDEVNSHFKLIKFRLFDYLKNGNVVDDCEPLIDNKSLKDHSNGALRVLAKLDILSGLQEFYNQHYPVFVDDYSLVTENTDCRIDVDFQIIKLKAVEGVKELQIVTE